MDLDLLKWDNDTYNDYLDYLKSLADVKYLEFNKKIINTNYKMLGIRVPLLKKIAKKISKGDVEEFLKFCEPKYYEEVFIRGLVICSISDIKISTEEIIKFLKYIDNWAICDSFCNSLKIVNTNKDYFFKYFNDLIKQGTEYAIRVSLVAFINYYVEDKYIEEIFSIIDSINTDKYYVNMAIAWLLCEMYTKYKEMTLKYIKKSALNDFVINKTIGKIRDSYRIKDEDKELIKQFKR